MSVLALIAGFLIWSNISSSDEGKEVASKDSVQVEGNESPREPGPSPMETDDRETTDEAKESPSSSPTPKKSQPNGNPSSPNSPSDSGDPSMGGSDDMRFAEPTEDEMVRMVKAHNTFSWQDTNEKVSERAVAAGAVPGSLAERPKLWGDMKTWCVERMCAVELLRVKEIDTTAKDHAVVWIDIRFWEQGKPMLVEQSCKVTFSSGNDISRGLFSDIGCIGSTG